MNRQDFVEEMRVISRLRHPNITTIMGAVLEKGQEAMLLMEYMEKGSLYDILHNHTRWWLHPLLILTINSVNYNSRALCLTSNSVFRVPNLQDHIPLNDDQAL